MPKTVTARFDTEEAAERAFSAVAAEVPMRDSAVVGGGVAGSLVLDSLNLAPEDRAACEQQLSKGGFLLVAQVATESRARDVLRLLDGFQRAAEPEAPPTPTPVQPAASVPVDDVVVEQPVEAPASEPTRGVVAEERVPIVEEELRIGKREVVRGRSRVHTYVSEVPVREEVELLHEETHLERRPVNRRISEEEVAQRGLLQERVIEIAEMREEAVVTKEAFIREEVVVTKSVHSRKEQIEATVRRTEIETERLEPQEGAAAGASRELSGAK